MQENLVLGKRFAFSAYSVVVGQRNYAQVCDLAVIDYVAAAGKALGNVENTVFKDSGHAELPEIEDVFPLCISESGDELIAQSISLFLCQGCACVITEGDVDITRIACVDGVDHAEVQAAGGGYRDQHHRCEDADRRKPRAVALHAVGHRGNGDEVPGRVVIALVFLKNFAQQDAARYENEISADDDHDDGDEEDRERLQGLLYADGKDVGRGEQDNACYAKHGICLDGLFAVAFAVHELDRRAAVQLDEAADVDQRENAAEVQEHVFDGGKRYVQRIIRRAAEHVQKYHFREL